MPKIGPPTDPPGDFEGKSEDEIADEVKSWFFENFEDPQYRTPYDAEAESFTYILGGPFDTEEELYRSFENILDDAIIDRIVKEIDEDTIGEWAPGGARLIFDGDDYQEPSNPAYNALLESTQQLEGMLGKIPVTPSYVGGNNPPDDIGLPPYRDEDEQSVREAISIIYSQSEVPGAPPQDAIVAAEKLNSLGNRLKDFVAKQSDNAVNNYVKSFSSELGKRSAQGLTIGLLISFSDKLLEVAQKVRDWLESMSFLF